MTSGPPDSGNPETVTGFLPTLAAVHLAAFTEQAADYYDSEMRARRATMAAMWTARPYIIAEAFADMADNLRDINENSAALVLDSISAELRKALTQPERQENPA